MPKIEIDIFASSEHLTCKDCLIYEKCSEDAYTQAFYEGKVDKVLMFIANRIPCKHFKNKADYAGVRHSEWIVAGEGVIACSLCEDSEFFTFAGGKPYCPNCGAKMDKIKRK